MIESKAELPGQEGVPATIWMRARQILWLGLSLAQRWVRALRESQVVARAQAMRLFGRGRAGHVDLPARPFRLLEWVRANRTSFPLLDRFALHLVVILLAVGVVVVTQVRIPQIELELPAPSLGSELGEETTLLAPAGRGGSSFVSLDAALLPAPVAHTIIAERERTWVITYTVQPNDNLWVIAQGFGLQVETLLWANAEVENDPDLLSVDQVLLVPPVDGVYYTVQRGDTVDKLAKKYKTSAAKIVGFEANALQEPYTLAEGQKLMLPDGRKPIPVYNLYPMTRVGSPPKGALVGTGRLAWPTRGYLSQRYWSLHLAIDIANREGTPVLAADDGYVVMAGLDTAGYGNQVLINHGNGFMTRYAHLQRIYVTAGDSVKKNQKIGLMGDTGRSTGPHLHFEVIQGRERRNPLSYLP